MSRDPVHLENENLVNLENWVLANFAQPGTPGEYVKLCLWSPSTSGELFYVEVWLWSIGGAGELFGGNFESGEYIFILCRTSPMVSEYIWRILICQILAGIQIC